MASRRTLRSFRVADLDLGGMMKITRCSANDSGGLGSEAFVNGGAPKSTASGALYATRLTQSGGTLTIRDSEAAVDGGAGNLWPFSDCETKNISRWPGGDTSPHIN